MAYIKTTFALTAGGLNSGLPLYLCEGALFNLVLPHLSLHTHTPSISQTLFLKPVQDLVTLFCAFLAVYRCESLYITHI